MYIEMRRIFHPVGQGAFYSESFYTGFGKFNMIYDCGSMSKGVDNVISESFNKKDDIDILFISHFDSDHVNKIALLKKSVNKIKKVIMPLIPDGDKGILLAFNIASNREYQDCANIIINPQAFSVMERKLFKSEKEKVSEKAPETIPKKLKRQSTSTRSKLLKLTAEPISIFMTPIFL